MIFAKSNDIMPPCIEGDIYRAMRSLYRCNLRYSYSKLICDPLSSIILSSICSPLMLLQLQYFLSYLHGSGQFRLYNYSLSLKFCRLVVVSFYPIAISNGFADRILRCRSRNSYHPLDRRPPALFMIVVYMIFLNPKFTNLLCYVRGVL